MSVSPSWLVSRALIAAHAGTQQSKFGRIYLTLACKAAAVEALHAAAATLFHCNRMLKVEDISQGFHNLVVGLKGHVGIQLAAAATLIKLCLAEVKVQHPDSYPTTANVSPGTIYINMMRIGNIRTWQSH